MSRICLMLIVVLCSAGIAAAKDWRGILPLHSTRADVERLMGLPLNLHGRSGYSLKEWEISFFFAEMMSPDRTECLSVAEGTVLSIRVVPTADLTLKDLNLDERRFRKFNPTQFTETDHEGFLDEEEGFVIRTRKGLVQEMVYLASAVDRPRCPDFYSDMEMFVRVTVGCHRKFDEFGDISLSDEKARLDNFAIHLSNTPDVRGHVIVYAGQKALVAEAQMRANRIKDYLINVREIRLDQLTVADGGHRQSLTVELHILPVGVTPPEPYPTVDAKDVEIIYEKPKRRTRNRN